MNCVSGTFGNGMRHSPVECSAPVSRALQILLSSMLLSSLLQCFVIDMWSAYYSLLGHLSPATSCIVIKLSILQMKVVMASLRSLWVLTPNKLTSPTPHIRKARTLPLYVSGCWLFSFFKADAASVPASLAALSIALRAPLQGEQVQRCGP